MLTQEATEYTSLSSRRDSPQPPLATTQTDGHMPTGGPYDSISSNPKRGSNDGETDNQSSRLRKSVALVCCVGTIAVCFFIFALTQISQANGGSHSHGTAAAGRAGAEPKEYITGMSVSQSETEEEETQTEYVFSQFLSSLALSQDKANLMIHSENDFSDYDYLSELFIDNEMTHYHISKIVKPKYDVEWIFGSSYENEEFVIVLQIENDDQIKEINVFSSKQNEDSVEALHRRLFDAFDFNKNGVLCITEFPSMIGGVSGLGSIEMSNSIVSSFMKNEDDMETHIKFSQDEYVEAVLAESGLSALNSNFGDLRKVMQNGVMDGYFAIMESNNMNEDMNCYYFDLAWNCDENNKYYSTFESDRSVMYSVSDSVFASVCCASKAN